MKSLSINSTTTLGDGRYHRRIHVDEQSFFSSLWHTQTLWALNFPATRRTKRTILDGIQNTTNELRFPSTMVEEPLLGNSFSRSLSDSFSQRKSYMWSVGKRERATATGDDIPRLEIYKAGHVNENSPFQTFALPYDSLPQSKGHPISKIGEEKGGIYSASFYTVTCPHPVAELKADHPLPRRRTRCSLWAACLPGRKLKPKG